MNPSIPVVKITNHRDSERIGCPNGKIYTGYTIDRHGMGTQFFVNLIADACAELLFLVKADLGFKGIRIIELLFLTFLILCFHFILRNFISRYQDSEKSCLIFHHHIISLFFFREQDPCLHSTGQKALDQNTVLCHTRSQNTARFAFLGIYNRLYFRPIHQFI